MEIHNITEDIVFAKVTEIFDTLEKEGGKEKFCTCNQCRLDAACYVLNRTEPMYIVSNRGVARVEQENFERQQKAADIAARIYEAVKRVNHNQRPNFRHGAGPGQDSAGSNIPVFNIPTIVGRLFHGLNFAPLSDIEIELRRDGELVTMKDGNWQNPYLIVEKTEGTFTFWPTPVPADSPGLRKIFEFSLRAAVPDFEPLNHFFQIPVNSEVQTAGSFSMDRTFKLPDLYLFPPGGEEEKFQDFPDN